MAAKSGPPVAAGPYLPDGARCKEVFSKIGEWGPGLRKELAELEAKSQKISNRAEKQLFMKEGQPKIIYTKLMSDFLTRPELYKSSYLMEGRSFEDNELLAVVVASVKDAWVKGKRVPVAFTYLGRVAAGQRSGGLATTLFGTFIRFLYKQGIEYLTCYVLEENTHSLRIFQRLGMLKQGHRVVFCLKVEEGLSLVTFPHEEISTVTTTTSSLPGSAKTVVHRTEMRKVDDDEAEEIVNRFYDKSSILLADIKRDVFQMKQHVGAFHATYTSSDDSSTDSEAFALVWDVDYGKVKVNKQNLPYWLVYSPRYKGPKGEDLLAKLLSGIQGLCIEKGVKYLMVEASSTSLGVVRLLQSLPNVLSSSTEWLIACRISRMLDYMKLYQQLALKQKQLKEQQKQAASAAAATAASSTSSSSSSSSGSSSSSTSSSSSEGQLPSVIPGPRAGPNMIPPGPEDFFYPGADLFQFSEGSEINPLAPEAAQVPFFDPRDVSTLMFFTPLRDNAQLQLTRKLSENSATGSSAIKARL